MPEQTVPQESAPLIPKPEHASLIKEPVHTQEASNDVVINSALVNSAEVDSSVQEAFRGSKEQALILGEYKAAQNALRANRDRNLQGISDMIQETRGTDLGVLSDRPNAANFIRNQEDSDLSTGSPDSALALAAVETMSRMDAKSTQEVSDAYVLKSIGVDAITEQSGWDWIKNIAGLIAVTDTIKDQSDMIRELGLVDDNLAGNVDAISQRMFLDIGQWYKDLPPEKKKLARERIVRASANANDDNAIKFGAQIFDLLEADDTWQATLEGLDGFMFLGWAANLVKAVKTMNTVRMASKVGNVKQSAVISETAALDPEVAKVLGIEEGTLTNNAFPVRTSVIDPNSTDNVSAETIRQAAEAEEFVATQIVKSRADALEVPLVSMEESKAFAKVYQDDADKVLAEFNTRPGEIVSDHQVIVTNNPREILLERTTVDPATEALAGVFGISPEIAKTRQTVRRRIQFDEVGGYKREVVAGEENPLSYVGSKVLHPDQVADRLFPDFAATATQMDQQADRLIETYGRMFKGLREEYGMLSKSERSELDLVLHTGDKEGKVYSLQELKTGVQTEKGLIALDGKVAVRYKAERKLWDELFALEDARLVQRARTQGFRSTTLKEMTPDGFEIPANVNIIRSKAVSGERVWVPELKKSLDPASKEFLELQGRGYGVWRTSRPVERGSTQLYNRVLLPKDVDAPVTKVLTKHKGYVLRSGDNDKYFVRVPSNRKLNGRQLGFDEAGGYRTIGRASSLKAARAWLDSDDFEAALTALNVDRATLPKNIITRDSGAPLQGEEAVSVLGADVTSPRARHVIADITGEGLASPGDTLTGALASFARKSSMDEFLSFNIERWKKSAAPYLDNPGEGFQYDMTKMPSYNNKLAVSNPTRKILEYQRRYILDLMRLPTAGEQHLQSMGYSLAELLEKIPLFDKAGGKLVRNSLTRLGTATNPADSLRSAAFHTLLGFYMPAQMLVQASWAANIAAARPQNIPFVLKRIMALRYATNLSRKGQDVLGLKETASAFGVPFDEFKGMMKAFDRSGIAAGIRSQADLVGAVSGQAVDPGKLKRFFENGTVFFYEGELLSRSYAFLDAAGTFMKSSGKSWDALSDADIAQITTKALDSTLNPSRANRALWQRGVAGVPTQFWQIMAKSSTAIFGGKNSKFTPGERSRIIAAQLALYGSAGIPAGGWIVNKALEATGKEDWMDDPEYRAAAQQGLTGALFQTMFGANPDLSSRVSLFGQVDDFLIDLIDDPLGEQSLNAVGTVFDRTGSVIKSIGSLMRYNMQEQEFNNLNPTLLKDIYKNVVSVTSTGSSAWKAYYMFKIGQDASGRDVTVAESTLQALGISPLERSQEWDHTALKQNESEEVRGIVKRLIEIEKGILSGSGHLTNEERQVLIGTRHLVMEALSPRQKESAYRSLDAHYKSNRWIELVRDSDKFKIEGGEAGLWNNTPPAMTELRPDREGE